MPELADNSKKAWEYMRRYPGERNCNISKFFGVDPSVICKLRARLKNPVEKKFGHCGGCGIRESPHEPLFPFGDGKFCAYCLKRRKAGIPPDGLKLPMPGREETAALLEFIRDRLKA